MLAVHELRLDEARDLFIQHASRAGASMAGQQAEIDAICSAVGCQPLALELLAARAALVPLHRLLERVQKSLDVIDAASDPTRSDRRRSARLCIELSFKDLSTSARELLERLSVFANGAGPAVISAVTGTEAWDSAAEELVAASVWRLSGRRYTMHPLVRQIALEQLVTDRGECELGAARALTHFVCAHAAEAKRHAADPAALKGAIDWCEAELPNLVASAGFAFAAEDWGSVSTLAAALLNVFQIRGHWSDAEHLYVLSLAAARCSCDRAGEAAALNHLGWVYRQQGRWTEAEAAPPREPVPLAGNRRPPRRGQHAETSRTNAPASRRFDDSSAVCQQALALLQAAGDSVGEAKTLAYLANIHRFEERWDVAVEVYQQALAISRRIGDLYDEGEIVRHLGEIYQHQGHYDQAKQALQRSLTIWRAFDDRHNEALILDLLGAILRDEGRWNESQAMLDQSLAVFREFRDRRKEGGALLNLARLDAARGNPASALDIGRQAVALLEESQDNWLFNRARDFVSELTRQAGALQETRPNQTSASEIGVGGPFTRPPDG